MSAHQCAVLVALVGNQAKQASPGASRLHNFSSWWATKQATVQAQRTAGIGHLCRWRHCSTCRPRTSDNASCAHLLWTSSENRHDEADISFALAQRQTYSLLAIVSFIRGGVRVAVRCYPRPRVPPGALYARLQCGQDGPYLHVCTTHLQSSYSEAALPHRRSCDYRCRCWRNLQLPTSPPAASATAPSTNPSPPSPLHARPLPTSPIVGP